MRAPSDVMALLTRHTPRGAWLRYALLVGLCLTTVAVSLYAGSQQRLLSGELVRLHGAWSDRLARYGRFNQLALDISAPCNEVFDSGDLEAETARSRRARATFDAQVDSARLELAHLRRGVSSAPLLNDLQVVVTATDDMLVDVGRTFVSFGVGSPPDVAVINAHLAHINEAVARLTRHAREAQGLEAKALLGSAVLLQNSASAVLVLISALVLVVSLLVRPAPPQRVILPDRGRVAAATRDPERAPAAPRGGETPVPHVLDAVPDPVIMLDEGGRITGWNAHAERVFGRPADAVRGLRLTEAVIAPRHREELDRGLAGFLESGDAAILHRRLEIAALDHEGREFPIELAIVPTRTARATVFSVFARDVTERRRADEHLRRLSIVASKTASGILVTDAMGRIEWANDAFAKITGWALEDVLGKAPEAVLRGPSTAPVAIDRMVEAVRSGTAFSVELASEARDGRPYWVEVEATPGFDEGGRLSQFIVIVTDVSERRRAGAALLESESRARVIVEGMAEGIVTIDDVGTITMVNPASERIFEYRPGELIGKYVRTLLPCLDDGAAGQNRGGAPDARSWSVTGDPPWGLRRNGAPFAIELSVGEVRLDGRRSWTCIVRDMTRRKRAEALQTGHNRVLELLATGAPLAGTLTELIRMVEEQQPGIVCMILILHPGETRLRIGAPANLADDLSRAVEGVEIGPAGCSWGAAAHLKQRVIVDDTAIHPVWADFRQLALDHGLRSSWAEPILSASGHPLGAFAVFRRRVHTPDTSELEVVSSAAHMAALAIERSWAAEALGAYILEEAVGRAG